MEEKGDALESTSKSPRKTQIPLRHSQFPGFACSPHPILGENGIKLGGKAGVGTGVGIGGGVGASIGGEIGVGIENLDGTGNGVGVGEK